MKVEYYGMKHSEKEKNTAQSNEKIEFKGQVFIPGNIYRYSFEEGFFRESVGKVYLRTGEVFTFKCWRNDFLSIFGKRR